MYEIHIIIVVIFVVLAIIYKYTCNFLNIPAFISKVIEFLWLIPFYAYIPIIIAALGFSKIVELSESIPPLIIFMYFMILIVIYILAYFITTPQIYM